MPKFREILTAPCSVPNWLFWLLNLMIWLMVGHDFYEWWTFDRPLQHCIEQKLYRCDIGDTKVFITYNGYRGPDE